MSGIGKRKGDGQNRCSALGPKPSAHELWPSGALSWRESVDKREYYPLSKIEEM